MKHFKNLKKHLYFAKALIIIIFFSSISLTVSRSLSSNKAACSISTISIPIGTNTPVMIYNARMEEENLQLTVLEKDHLEKYQVEGNLFYTDKETGESWYANKNVDEKNLETMRDAFSLCRVLNNDNKQTKAYESSRVYMKYRTEVLPKNVALRVSNKEENARKQTPEMPSKTTTSFLQVKSQIDIVDDQMEKDLEELERDDAPNMLEQEYKNLNNDAYIENEKLHEQLEMDSGLQPTTDLYID